MLQVVILCSSEQKEELVSGTAEPATAITWIDTHQQFADHPHAACCIDLLFENSPERIAALSALAPAVVIVSSVENTLTALGAPFVRVNGWNTFLSSPIIEAAAREESQKVIAAEAFSLFGKSLERVSDHAGFITPRVVCSIINEAYFALEDGVSTKAEIDVAMKLGTAYPYGPFEWAQKIGLKKIASLLQQLAKEQSRYAPCSLLLDEAEQAS